MDPLESAVATSRVHKRATLDIMRGVLLVLWCDVDGSLLVRPALITHFAS